MMQTLAEADDAGFQGKVAMVTGGGAAGDGIGNGRAACLLLAAAGAQVFGEIRRQLGPIFHELTRQKECRSIEGHVMPDHIQMCLEVPPKHAVASVIGFIKGKSAIAIARQFGVVIGMSPASTSGLVAMRFRWWALSWNKSQPISVTKTPAMMTADFRPLD